jgi:hypothetical protein
VIGKGGGIGADAVDEGRVALSHERQAKDV